MAAIALIVALAVAGVIVAMPARALYRKITAAR